MKKSPLKKQKRGKRPSLYELSKDLCGCISGPRDLSTRKLVGYGRDSAPTFANLISRKRKQIATLREELEDLSDSLDLIEARIRNEAKPRQSFRKVLKELNIRS